MLTKGDLDQIRKIIKEETHYPHEEGKISIVSISRDISKLLEGFVSVLTQGDQTQALVKKLTNLVEKQTESTKQK